MKSTTPVSKIKTEFSLQNATSFGGIKVFLGYLEKIKLAEGMRGISGGKALNALFPVHRIIQYLIIGWMLGCERIFHFRKLQHDALLNRFLGGRCPHHSLLYKELGRLGKSCPQLAAELRMLNQAIIRSCLPAHLILDLDSTVEIVYGDQAGAAKGTNPHKPGRKSYHPLLAFEGQTRLNLNAVLRPGNTHSSTDAADFLQQTFNLLGERQVKYARFDKGFGGEDFYSMWENKSIGYVGKLKWTKRLAKEVQACRYWTRYVDEDWIIEGISLIYQATSWKKARRVAIIRKAQDRIATSDFKANELDLLIKLLAYNLFERFKRDCCEPVHRGYTIARFRLEFFHCAATLIQHSRSVVLKLMKDFVGRYTWTRIEAKAALLE